MSTLPDTEALIAQLSKVEGKAEIVGGGREIVVMSPTGDFPCSASLSIAVSLRANAR